MKKIDGKEIARKIIEDLKQKQKPKKFLAVFLVGNDPASVNFVAQKEKIAKELGLDFRIYKPDENLNNDKLRAYVRKISSTKRCGGVIVQLPLPAHINQHYILNVIPVEKDIDVMSERALGAFYNKKSLVLPPSVATVNEIILSLGKTKNGFEKIAIVGQGFLVGRPNSLWFMGETSEVYSLDKGSNFSILKEADLVICGTGKPDLISPPMLKNSAIVIDFGYGVSAKTEKMSGDFDSTDNGGDILYTPTPGGTGPVLVASLFSNFYKLNEDDSVK